MFSSLGIIAAGESYEGKANRIAGASLERMYRMDDQSGSACRDTSSNGTDGTYINTPTLADIVSPARNKAPLLDGVDEYVTLGTLSPLGNSADFSFGVWMKVFNSGVWTDGIERTSMMIQNTSSNWCQIKRHTVNNTMRMECRSGGSTNNLDIGSMTTTDWFHIGCVVKNTGDMEVYLDGVSQGTITKSSSWTGSGGWLNGALGRASDVNNRFWNGYLSHAFISDIDHTDAEMLDLGVNG